MLVVEKLKQLVASERKITAEIIEHIQEVDQKKIYGQMGYPTLFSFLTEYIGYSAASAQRRIEAARLLNAVPEVKKDIQSGSLNLSQVALVAQSIRQKQKEMPQIQIKAQDKKGLLESIKNQNFEQSQKIISQTLDLEIKAFERKTLQKDESVRWEITFTKDQMVAFHKVKSLISHINPSASVAEVFDYLAKDYLKRKDPMQCGAKNGGKYKTSAKYKTVSEAEVKTSAKYKTVSEAEVKTSAKLKTVSETEVKTSTKLKTVSETEVKTSTKLKTVSETEMKTSSKPKTFSKVVTNNKGVLKPARKRIPISIKRAVWTRDHGQCQHFNPTTGKMCGSAYLLEIDHIKRVRHGGDNDPKNLQLLCHTHNYLRG
jgi:hypothetical protein